MVFRLHQDWGFPEEASSAAAEGDPDAVDESGFDDKPATDSQWILRSPSAQHLDNLLTAGNRSEIDWGTSATAVQDYTKILYEDYLHVTGMF